MDSVGVMRDLANPAFHVLGVCAAPEYVKQGNSTTGNRLITESSYRVILPSGELTARPADRAHPPAKRSRTSRRCTSEGVLQAQLHHPLGLAKSEVAGGCDPAGVGIQELPGRVANGWLQHRIVKLRMVKQIEKLRAELNPMAFAEQEVLREIYVPIVDPAALDDAFSGVSEAARSRV